MLRTMWRWLTPGAPRSVRGRPERRRSAVFIELLEERNLPSTATPDHVLFSQAGAAKPMASSGPTGTTPTQIRHAYGFDQISFAGGAVAADGSGMTIAIVDAYDDPNIASDLHQFDLRFGLPDPPSFRKVNQTGGSAMPAADSGWASEIALDVEWAHALAPKASILLVEANSASYSDLMTAVGYAASQPGVVVVSMSFGGGESSSQKSYDSVFRTPSGHAGVTFIASSGDSGAPASYPASSPNVLAVGGTTARLDGSGNITQESAWSGSGGGTSSVEPQPSYQRGFVTQTSQWRGNPDVSYDSDPNTGFPVYDSYNNPVSAPWSQFGGTSDAAPQWAALIAIADQGRATLGLAPLDGATQTLPQLYALPASSFIDITSGRSTGQPSYSATSGYDLATGRGSPHANLVVAGLMGQTATVGATQFSVTSSASSTTAGSTLTLTVKALDPNGATVTSYLGSLHFTSTDLAAVLPSDYTFTSADKGVHQFTVTLTTAGSQSVTATDKANSFNTGSVGVTISAANASKLAFGQQPTSAGVNATISPAVTVQLFDAYGNLATGDNTDQVTLSLASNPGSATLAGTTVVTVRNGVATFSGLSLNQIANGYTLAARSGSLSQATSASFNISAAGNAVESFETTETWNIGGGGFGITGMRTTAAAHDGTYGLDDYNGNDWIYRTGGVDQVQAGDTASVWLKFAGNADGRAYFGFGAGGSGTLALVAAPNTGQLVLQWVYGYGSYMQLAAVNQTYQANHWYRLEVDWGASGTIVGKLFDTDGTTLLGTVSAATNVIVSGGIGFRATGSDKYWDTVTINHGVNNFTVPHAGSSTPSAVASQTPGFFWSTSTSSTSATSWAASSYFVPAWYFGLGAASSKVSADWDLLLQMWM